MVLHTVSDSGWLKSYISSRVFGCIGLCHLATLVCVTESKQEIEGKNQIKIILGWGGVFFVCCC